MTLHSQSILTFYIRRAVIGLLAFLMAGCATMAPKPPPAPVFYPPLPNPPRIQYLVSFTAARDVGGRPSAFAEFVLGKESSDADIVKKPYGVTVHDGKVYTVDTRGPGYAIFDLVNTRFKFVSGSGGGKMRKPINITIDQDGTKYITDTGREQVLVFDRDDRYVRAYGRENEFKPSDVVIAGDKLFIADLMHHQIQVLDKHSGALLYKFSQAGSKEGELFTPTNLALGPDDHLYVSDTGNFRVQKFTLDGKFIRSYGSVGTGLGQFARPKGVSVDREGRIYVVDAAFENVQIMNQQGKLLLFFGGSGNDPENINLPTDIEIDYDNVGLFQKYADPNFKLEYVILVASQFGGSKVNAFGFGKMEGMEYPMSGVEGTVEQ